MIRIAIVDDHPMVLTGIQNMLRTYEHIEVTGIYSDGASLLDALEGEQPDVLLLDIQLPEMTGEQLAPVISTRYPSIKLLALTSLDTPFHIRSMFEKGCLGYLLKNTDHKTLVDAIETVYSGEQYLEPSLKEELFHSLTKPQKQVKLTRREKEILQLIGSELTTSQMATQLYLSPKTVENHRLSLMQKFGVKNTAGLIKAAINTGFLE